MSFIERILGRIVSFNTMAKTTKKLKSTESSTNGKTEVTPVTLLRTEINGAKAVRKTAPNGISLEFVKPDAKQVCVAGSFNEWKPETTPLIKMGNGRWVGNLAVKPGRHEYLFVVDGQWLPDPNARET